MKRDKEPLTPKELMISRYEAFVKEDWNYLVKTSTHQTLDNLSNPYPIEWLKLEVLNDYDNIVEFKAYYRQDSKLEVLHEKSVFTKLDGEWKYETGELYKSKIERNMSCPCGSGKKFKKCCG